MARAPTMASGVVRPESGARYQVTAVGATGVHYLKEPGDVVAFGKDPACHFVFPDTPDNENISWLTGLLIMGDRHPTAADFGKNGLWLPTEGLPKALRDEPTYRRSQKEYNNMFNARNSSVSPALNTLIAEYWIDEYVRDPSGIGFLPGKQPRISVACYSLESAFHRAERDAKANENPAVEIYLGHRKSPKQIKIEKIPQ